MGSDEATATHPAYFFMHHSLNIYIYVYIPATAATAILLKLLDAIYSHDKQL